MTITQHKADELFTKLVEAQAPVRPERLAEIQVAAESGWELAGDYIHLARAWLASQQALRDVIAENAALRQRVQELELYASDTDFDRNDMARQINEANARVDELEAQLKAREEDFRTQNTLLLKIAELKRRNEELEALLSESVRLKDLQDAGIIDGYTFDGEGTA